MENIKLSVVIPAYNESKRLPRTLEEVSVYLSRQSYDYEIIVANDGSKDSTAQTVRNFFGKINNLRLVDNEKNHGKGYIVRQGMMSAKGEYILFTDADNSTSIDQIEKMWPEFDNGYDVVIGSRDIKGAVLDPPQPWIREIILGNAFKLFRKIVIGLWSIEDTQCGFKCFRQKVVKDVFPKCLINRFAFDPEMLLVAKKFNYKIKEIPISWKNDLASTVNLKGMIRMAFDLFKIKWNVLTCKYSKH